MKKEIYHCDICEAVINDGKGGNIGYKMQVIFTTEQDEGRSSDPYFANEEIDICDECKERALCGHYVFARGAQGYNEYYFRTPAVDTVLDTEEFSEIISAVHNQADRDRLIRHDITLRSLLPE